MRGLVLAVVVAVAAAPAPGAAARQNASGAPSDTPASRTVRVDVIAVDSRGRRVENLKPQDFDLREDGALQTIDTVRFVKTQPADAQYQAGVVDSLEDERTEAKRPNTRLVGIFLDEYHVSPANSARVREGVQRFVADSLSPQDLIVVMRPLDSLFSIRVTRDRDRIRQIIESFDGRLGDYTARNSYERNYMAGAPARIEQLRTQVAVSALNALASHLGSLDTDARKTLIVVSEGLTRPDRRRGLDILPTVDTVARSANRHNVAIYAVDPRPPGGGGSTAEPDALRVLAVSTNGQPITGVADLGDEMRPIASDAGGYYLVLYRTSQKPDGRFHDLKVTVKKPGVTARTRQGYWAPAPDEGLRAALLSPRKPKPPEPARHISSFISPWFGMSRGEDGKTRVTFVWEPARGVPGLKQQMAAHVVLTALAPDDTALFEGRVEPTGPLRPDAADESSSRAVFEVPPGVVRLRMSIENEAEQAIDSDVRDLTVRDLSAGVVLGTPLVFRGRTALDFRAFDTAVDATPVAARDFSRAEHLVIRVPAYGGAGTRVTVAARLTNRKGQLIRDLATRPGTADRPLAEIDLPLASFAVGEYRIEMSAMTAAAKVTDVLEFRVTD